MCAAATPVESVNHSCNGGEKNMQNVSFNNDEYIIIKNQRQNSSNAQKHNISLKYNNFKKRDTTFVRERKRVSRRGDKRRCSGDRAGCHSSFCFHSSRIHLVGLLLCLLLLPLLRGTGGSGRRYV